MKYSVDKLSRSVLRRSAIQNPKKKLLVVIDMQNDFVYGDLGTDEAKAICSKVVDYVNNFDGDIFFTKDTHYAGYLDSQEGKKLPVRHCVFQTNGWELIDGLDEKKAKGVFLKTTFGSTRLAECIAKLQEEYNYYSEVQICGLCTGICVISNAMLIKAFCPEIPIKVIADLCACVTPESHQRALESMKTCQIDII